MTTHGGHSMVNPLRRIIACTPEAAGWFDPERSRAWRDLGYVHEPVVEEASAQHAALLDVLRNAGVEVTLIEPEAALSLDAVYAHDASLVTGRGAIVLRPGKPARMGESAEHAAAFDRLGIPTLGRIDAPGTVESGDLVWLDERTLLVGRGYRTNAAGRDQLAALLAPLGVTAVDAPLPHGPGPDACLHLMSLLSPLDDDVMLVDLPWLSVPTIELLRARGVRLIEIDPSERDTLACNVLALGGRRVVAFEENVRTIGRLASAGFEVLAVPGSEIGINGAGGPTCLTRPTWRSPDVAPATHGIP